MSESVIVTTLQLERFRREVAGVRAAHKQMKRRLDVLEFELSRLVANDVETHAMTGGIQGLPGSMTITGFEWEQDGEGMMVLEEDG